MPINTYPIIPSSIPAVSNTHTYVVSTSATYPRTETPVILLWTPTQMQTFVTSVTHTLTPVYSLQYHRKNI